MANAYRGEADLLIGERRYTLAFDWHAIATLRTHYGSEWANELARAIDDTDMETIAHVLTVGLAKHHGGELSAKDVMDLSPPVNVVTEAINRAIIRAFTGDRPQDEETDAGPRTARLRTLLSRVFGSPARPASSRASSGA